MTLRKRRLLFFLFFIAFVVLGAFLVSYSQGWRFSFNNLSFEKTGAIYVKSEPYDAGIKIDGRPVKNKAWFFGGGTLIADMTPGFYEVKVFKTGYRSWGKNLEVFPSFVSAASDIVLVPEQIVEAEVKNGVSGFWENGDRLIWSDGKNLWFEAGGKKIKLPGVAVAGWRADSDYVVTASSSVYFLVNLSRSDSFLNVSTLFNNIKERQLNLSGVVPIVKIITHPFDNGRLIIATRKALYILDTVRLTLEIIGDKPTFIAIFGSEAVWASEQAIYSYHLLLKTKTALVENLESGVSDVASSGGYLGILLEDGALILIRGKEAKQISHSAGSFRFSPDGKKVAFLDRSGALKIYFLADSEDFKKRAGDYAELDLKAGAETAEWYKDSHHLLVKYPEEIYFTEIDDRRPLNFYRITGDVSDFYYNLKKNLYILKNDGHLVMEKIF